MTRFALFLESLGLTNFTWLLFGCLDFAMRGNGLSGSVESDVSFDDNDFDIELRPRYNRNSHCPLPISSPVHDCDSITV